MLPQDFKEFLQLLNEKKVEYLIVGGYAVALQGYPRYTGDIDIWFNPFSDNIRKVLNSIIEFGFSSLNITEKDLIKPNTVIQFGFPPLRIDLLNELDGVNFEVCYKNKNILLLDDLEINLINIEDLIVNKKVTGRHKDLDDIEHLSQFQEKK
ncbi:MAG: hypothetical protein HW421_2354 [Ignavibacteria bacterium]|nr:hypothetical protein [Ignavibacteria bacterium]